MLGLAQLEHDPGEAVQVHPMNPKLDPPRT